MACISKQYKPSMKPVFTHVALYHKLGRVVGPAAKAVKITLGLSHFKSLIVQGQSLKIIGGVSVTKMDRVQLLLQLVLVVLAGRWIYARSRIQESYLCVGLSRSIIAFVSFEISFGASLVSYECTCSSTCRST